MIHLQGVYLKINLNTPFDIIVDFDEKNFKGSLVPFFIDRRFIGFIPSVMIRLPWLHNQFEERR